MDEKISVKMTEMRNKICSKDVTKEIRYSRRRLTDKKGVKDNRRE
jgi:hypothetical protein